MLPLQRKGRKMQKNVEINLDLCIGCGECVKICPVKILFLDPVTNKSTVSNDSLCGGSGCCVKKCKQGAIKVRKKEKIIK